jgi:hypothetical protein
MREEEDSIVMVMVMEIKERDVRNQRKFTKAVHKGIA